MKELCNSNKDSERDLIFPTFRVIDRRTAEQQGTVVRMDNRAGQMLRDRRLELGMTQEEVALELGMSLHQYQRYEYGDRRMTNSPMRIGLRICAVLELDPYEIVFGTGP